ncbi:MAG TPA: hypothetical protein VGK58_16915, partial [Lacipirellulaceae bacterium]
MASARLMRSLGQLSAVTLLLCASGATCQRSMLVNPFAAPGPVAPEVLVEAATRDEIVAAVNQNSARIQSLSVTGASITIPDTMELPLLSGNIAAERPGRFRFTAGTSFGQEVDIGSNDELFWVWIRRNQPPAVYICRHDQFATSNIRQLMPVEPKWLLAALGIVELDPASVFDGPLPRGDGTVELRSWLPSASGTLQRVTVIDARRGWVVEQHVYDEAGTTLLASAVAESHRYYPLEQVSLPDRLSIRLPASGLAFKINLGAMQINGLAGDRQQLWALPTFEGYPQHDLGGAAPGTPLPGQLGPVKNKYPVIPTAHSAHPTNSYPAVSVPYTSPQSQPTQSGARPSVGSPTPGPLPRYGMP